MYIIQKQLSPQMVSDIKLHGILLWASMGFLIPVGILAIKFSNTEKCSQTRLRLLLYIHASLQVAAVLLATAGAILSIRSFENSFCNTHQRIGLALYGVIWFQALIGFRRPKRGKRGRSVWYFFHWILGTTISVVGIFNIYTGLQAYHKKTSRSIRLWTILFTAEVSILTFLYLLQDKWEYIKKKGVILGNSPVTPSSDQELPQTASQKDTLNESGRKSNSLGNYFAKSNALRKLFQLTSRNF